MFEKLSCRVFKKQGRLDAIPKRSERSSNTNVPQGLYEILQRFTDGVPDPILRQELAVVCTAKVYLSHLR